MSRLLVDGIKWMINNGTCPACGSSNTSTGCICHDCGWGSQTVVINNQQYDINEAPTEEEIKEENTIKCVID